MNETTTTATPADPAFVWFPLGPTHIGMVRRDEAVITWRNLVAIRPNRGVLLGVTLQPIIFLLIAFVFAGSFYAADPQGYREYLIGGIFAPLGASQRGTRSRVLRTPSVSSSGIHHWTYSRPPCLERP